MIEIYQKQFHGLISELMDSDTDEQYQSVLSTIYSIINNENIEQLDIVLRQNFPNYYDSPIPVVLNDN